MRDCKADTEKLIHAILKASVSTQQIIELGHFLPTHIPVLAIYGRLFALSAHLAQSLSLDLEGILGGGSGIEEVIQAKAAAAAEGAVLPMMDDPLEVPLGAESRRISTYDLGQRIARPVVTSIIASEPLTASIPLASSAVNSPSPPVPTPTPSRSPSPSLVPQQDSPDPDFPENLIPDAQSQSPAEGTSQQARMPRDRTPKVIKKKKRPVQVSEVGKKKKKRNDIDDIFGF